MKFFLYFLFFFLPIFVYSEPDFVTENAPETLVEGVSVITGDFCFKEDEITVQGLKPIRFVRNYTSDKGLGYVEMFTYHTIFYSSQANRLEITEPTGATCLYYGKGSKHGKEFFFDGINTKGMTNTARGKISGKNNLKNQRAFLEKSGKYLTVYCPDGTRRIYKNTTKLEVETILDKPPKVLLGPLSSFVLIKEELPDGNKIVYEWPKKKGKPWTIRSCNADETITYASAKFTPRDSSKERKQGDYKVETSDGRSFEHAFFLVRHRYQLKRASNCEKAEETLLYTEYKGREFLSDIKKDGGYHKHISYYIPKREYDGEWVGKSDPRAYRVRAIFAPLGDGGELVQTHTFFYDVEGKKTTVKDAYGTKRIYHWNEDLRLIKIERFLEDGSLYNSEEFVWGACDTPDDMNLLRKELFDKEGRSLLATSYVYDEFGNALEETLEGDLTGSLESSTYTKRFTYTAGGKNLLLSSEEENGLRIEYDYLKDTNLVLQERTYCHGALQKQKSYLYNKENILIHEREQDLVGSLDRVRDYTLIPYEKRYGGSTKEVEETAGGAFVKRVVFSYGDGGRLQEESLYDESGYRYTLQYKYHRGLLAEEVNALGYRESHVYTPLGEKIKTIPSDRRSEEHLQYDRASRLIKVVQEGEGQQRTRAFTYNHLHQQTSYVDEYGNKTHLVYDPYGNLLEKHLPEGGVEKWEYDAAGNEILYIDPLGKKTHTRYSAHGEKTKVLYPDGTEETFHYYSDGQLQSYTDQKGLKTTYTYDPLQRVLTEETPYTFVKYLYDSYNVVYHKDPMGYVTNYTYDASGHKVEKGFEGVVTSYTYDTTGRLITERTGDLVERFVYDDLDRVLEERKEDTHGNCLQKIARTYDAADNVVTTSRWIMGEEAVEESSYDCFSRQTYQKDPLGNVTTYTYAASPHIESVIDPLGLTFIKTYHGKHLHSLEKRSAKGETLLEEIYEYDLSGNKTKVTAFFGESVQKTLFVYDEMNRLSSLTEGADTLEEKTTRYQYNPVGEVALLIKPSGIKIISHYDLLGNLEEKLSSDRTVHYTYKYDLHGNVLESKDLFTGEKVTCVYDAWDNLLEETLPSGLTLKSSYDEQSRRQELTLPDGTGVFYTYDPLYLRSVTRKGNTHTYIAYDLDGNLLEEELPRSLGLVSYTYDLMGRKTSTTSSFFTQEDVVFDSVGNLLSMVRQGEHLEYAYDDLYQLIEEKEHSYTFDARHNRVEKDGERFTVNALNQTSELEYSVDGNPYDLKGKKLSYDALDRLIKVEDEHERIEYVYDAAHRRLTKKRYSRDQLIEAVYFLYDGDNEIGAYTGSLELTELRIPGIGPAEHKSVAFELGKDLYVPLHDLQGNVAALHSPDTGVQEEYSYTAFGEERSSAGISPWRFSSKRVDKETDLVYYGRRHYIPSKGRWLTPDPLGLEEGPNLYAFVTNAPLTHFDLYGLEIFDPFDNVDRTIENMQAAAIGFSHGAAVAAVRLGLGGTDMLYGFIGYPLHNGSRLVGWNGVADFFSYENYTHFKEASETGAQNFLQEKLPADETNSLYQKGAKIGSAAVNVGAIFIGVGEIVQGCRAFAASRTMVQSSKILGRSSFLNKTAKGTKNLAKEEKIVKDLIVSKGEARGVLPKDPKDLLPNLPRDAKGRIYTSDNLRILPEKHPWKTGDLYNRRHHGQHYHVETRRNPNNSWNHRNIEKIKPIGYQPGDGTGFLPEELFP